MNFKQMILVEYLLNNFLKSVTRKDYQLVFELDGRIYTGVFAPKSSSGIPITYDYVPGWKFKVNHSSFQPNKAQELRSIFFHHVFGEDSTFSRSLYVQYTYDLQHLILNDVINIVTDLDVDAFFTPSVKFPEVILDLKNMENETKFDHYVVKDREFRPVSFTEREDDKWVY